MKSDIHPKYYTDAKVTCACGNTFTTGSTQPQIEVSVCSACHPFYTGQQRFVDTQGQVEKFQRRQKAAGSYTKSPKKATKKAASNQAASTPKSLKEMLQTAQTA